MLIYPGQMAPLIELKCTEPYYTRTLLPIEECRHADIPRADGPPAPSLIEPKCTEPYYTRTVLPIEECRHADIPGQMAPYNWAQVYRALLHQDSTTYRRMQTWWYTQSRWTPSLIKPKCTEPYYTRTLLPIEECRHADIPRAHGPPCPLTNWAQVYRALLHQDSITYRRMQTCWYTQGWWPPYNWAQVYRALLHQDSTTYRRMQTWWYTQSRWNPSPIKPRCTEPYYIRTVLPIEEYRHDDIPRADETPP